MKTNLTLICLLPKYSKNVSKMLGEKLDMFFGDVDEMFDYEVGDAERILSVLGDKDGKKYLKDTENKVIKNVCNFENAIISINPTTLLNSKNIAKLKKTSYVVYLQISTKYLKTRAKYSGDEIDDKLMEIAFTERDKHYVEFSDIVVNSSTYKEKKAAKKVISAINAFFKKNKLKEK